VLDMPTLRKWNALMRIFTVEYLGLPVPSSSPGEVEQSAGMGMAARTDDLVSLSRKEGIMQRMKRKVRVRAELVFVLFRTRICSGYVVMGLVCTASVVIDRDNSISSHQYLLDSKLSGDCLIYRPRC
jgi:hypothetical protein